MKRIRQKMWRAEEDEAEWKGDKRGEWASFVAGGESGPRSRTFRGRSLEIGLS